MATATELKKIVREVFNEELGDSNEATLKAIQRLNKLLTEKIIPKLPDEHDEEEPGTNPEAPAALRSAAVRRRPSKPQSVKPVPEKPEEAEVPEEDDRPDSGIPSGVIAALEKAYQSLPKIKPRRCHRCSWQSAVSRMATARPAPHSP